MLKCIMVKRGGADSLSSDVYQQIRAAIFNGALSPGDRLQPSVLSETYSASTTVVREALALLAGERLIVSSAGRGFFVPQLILSELQDVTLVRCNLESLALQLAIERGGIEWESNLIAAHHRLVRTPRRTAENPNHPSEEWAKQHREFHEALVSACGVPVLLDLCRQMSAGTELYRIWAGPLPQTAKRDVAAEHAAILEATLAGDAKRAVELVTAHYQATADAIVANAPSGAAFAAFDAQPSVAKAPDANRVSLGASKTNAVAKPSRSTARPVPAARRRATKA
jgi:DNA-binding GntR family transcriptional regulator